MIDMLDMVFGSAGLLSGAGLLGGAGLFWKMFCKWLDWKAGIPQMTAAKGHAEAEKIRREGEAALTKAQAEARALDAETHIKLHQAGLPPLSLSAPPQPALLFQARPLPLPAAQQQPRPPPDG